MKKNFISSVLDEEMFLRFPTYDRWTAGLLDDKTSHPAVTPLSMSCSRKKNFSAGKRTTLHLASEKYGGPARPRAQLPVMWTLARGPTNPRSPRGAEASGCHAETYLGLCHYNQCASNSFLFSVDPSVRKIVDRAETLSPIRRQRCCTLWAQLDDNEKQQY